uniref:Zona pellucida sperm-binding protein 3 n=1 Tax=Neogobius melanostomus TaxID=47308 RepID=A0A8C6UQ97_9GOBI
MQSIGRWMVSLPGGGSSGEINYKMRGSGCMLLYSTLCSSPAVGAMLLKCRATCLLALALFSCLCVAQWNPDQQNIQTFERPLNWVYPGDPVPETPAQPGSFEIRHPVPVATVAVECLESYVHVEVKKDMFGTGHPINPDGLTLGDCRVTGQDSGAQVLIFEYELQNCGSDLKMTEDSFIYSYVLNYNPQVNNESPVVRTSRAAVLVSCHYPRRHNVSSLPLDPLWVPFSAVKVSEEFLYFSLKLMTDDWGFERPSYQYYLGDMIHIEATVMQYFHVPLRVYVDSCVATMAPDVNSNPRYVFIDFHGCFVDASITNSASAFLPRTVENKLRFQLEAFRFLGVESGLLYITCHLRATSAAHAINEQHRACSFIGNTWKEASGAHQACDSCGSGSWSGGGGSGTGTGGGSWSGGGGSGTGTGGGSWSGGGGSGTGTGGGSWSGGGGSGTGTGGGSGSGTGG